MGKSIPVRSKFVALHISVDERADVLADIALGLNELLLFLVEIEENILVERGARSLLGRIGAELLGVHSQRLPWRHHHRTLSVENANLGCDPLGIDNHDRIGVLYIDNAMLRFDIGDIEPFPVFELDNLI